MSPDSPPVDLNAPIFIIEDDVEQLSLFAAMVSELPYPLLTAVSGEHALEILRTTVPALVITDLVMQDVPGAQIVRYVRADERMERTKIIIVTSYEPYVTPTDRQLADRVLIKPIKKPDLIQAVRELLGY